MDKTLIRRRFAKAVGSYSIRADVQRQIAYHMADAKETPSPVPHRHIFTGGNAPAQHPKNSPVYREKLLPLFPAGHLSGKVYR